jgi:GNAT superfamily N-acetyltransferase
VVAAGDAVTATASLAVGSRYQLIAVKDAPESRLFSAAAESVYRRDPNWIRPLPGEESETFASGRNPALAGVQAQRWVLLRQNEPVGRIAAFAPAHRPGVGYIGFFESPDDGDAARLLLHAAEEWLGARGRRECYGPIAVTPRDRIGLLVEGFDRPPTLFTPYNPPYYEALLRAGGWSPYRALRAHGWDASYQDPRGVVALAGRAAANSPVRIRPLRLDRLREETRLVARLINETLAEAWHFDPISEPEAAAMARLLRPVLDPSIALVAEDGDGPCAVALAVPDVNWLWRRAGCRVWPMGWARLLRYRRRIQQVRLMALGLAQRVQRTGLAARLIAQLHQAALARGYIRGEIAQVYDDNLGITRILDRMRFPVVRRYAVFARSWS